jgi:hypothetical protein
MPRHNPYRPGTLSYERLRRADLRRREKLAVARVARAKTPEVRRRAQRQAASARRSLRQIETRGDFRASLNKTNREMFDNVPIKQQQRLMTVARSYPEKVPADIPDPFADHFYQRRFYRGPLWNLYYSTRAGIRQRPNCLDV